MMNSRPGVWGMLVFVLFFTYFQVGNLIVEVSRVKDSVKKLLETDFELYNVRKQELFSVFHKCFE